jgi:uracil permease
MVVTALSAHYGKKRFISLIPFVVGMGAGYILAVLFTLIGYKALGLDYFNVVNFTPFENIFGKENVSFASFFNYNLFVPNHEESFIFLRFDYIKQWDWACIGSVMLLFIPVAFVTICEHVGDHENLGNIIGRDLLNDEPGMKRTLLGDGIATAVSGALCGAANTTYGENVAVIGTTKIASVNVVLLAAILAIAFGFITPFTALLSTIPACVTGGVSLILYGFIASSGVKMLIHEKIDFNVPKNIFIASVILIAGIGGLAFKFYKPGNPDNPVVTITSIAVAMILGIFLNLVLVEKKDEKSATESEAEAEEVAEEAPVVEAEAPKAEVQE